MAEPRQWRPGGSRQREEARQEAALDLLSGLCLGLLEDDHDEGVEEDMPPQAEGQRLEMTPEFMSALKAKGAADHVLPDEIAKKM